MDVPRREEACRGVPMQKDHKQALLAARVAVGFLDAAVAQERPGCRHLDEVTEGVPSKSGSPHRSRQHPQKYRNRHLEEE
ncbi:hypothetical protein NDU88_006040 [Pleurodeles waltl]|uniref:Uncharacterized protein n=1 Tax=Pleurodeles waltl TaxID=8319 RepID=A0AAV7N1W6_PLEWA|nr:hypothetical protein NDU88_006040 [Pleurodeles waltl]